MDIFTLLAGLSAGAWALWAVCNWSAIGWVLIGLTTVFDTSEVLDTAVTNVGGVQLYPEDLVSGLLLGSALARAGNIGANLRGRSTPYWAFMALLSASLLEGVVEHGPSAVNEFRGFAYLIVIALWVLSLDWADPRTGRHFDRWVIGLGIALSVSVAIGLSRTGLVSADAYTYTPQGEAITLRPVHAAQALVLSLAGLWTFHRYASQRAPRWLLVSALFWGAAVLAQHRSVWGALTAGVLVYLLVAGRGTRMVAAWTVFAALVGVVFVALAGWARPVVSVFAQSFSSATATSSTFTGRTFAWKTLIDRSIDEGPLTVLFGQDFGDGWARTTPDGILETYVPHNWYVVLYLRIGLIGLALLAALVWSLARRNSVGPGRNPLHLAALALLAVYIFAYVMPPYAAPFIAVIILRAVAPSTNNLNVENGSHRTDTSMHGESVEPPSNQGEASTSVGT